MRRYTRTSLSGESYISAGPSEQNVSSELNCVFPWKNPSFSERSFPAYLSTLQAFPADEQTMRNTAIDVSIVCSPGTANDFPVVDYSQRELPKCKTCGAFVSAQTISNYEKYNCAICNASNTWDMIPEELKNQGYDLMLTEANPAKKPVMFFVADVSIPSVASGYTSLFLTSLKLSLANIDPNICVGFATISDKIVVYDLEGESELVITDLNDICAPEINYPMLKNVADKFSGLIDRILTQTPTAGGHCLGSLYELSARMLARTGGLMIVQCFGLPTVGPKALHPRTNQSTELALMKMYGQECMFYRDIGVQFNRVGIGLRLFACTTDASVDLSVIGIPAGFTGNVYLYRTNKNMNALYTDLFATVTNEYFWSARFSVYLSPGVKLLRCHGNMLSAGPNTLSFPILACNNTFTLDLTVSETQIKTKDVLIQTCLLWRTKTGQQMLRVFTMALPVSNDVRAIHQTVDEVALVMQLKNHAIYHLHNKDARSSISALNEEIAGCMRKGLVTPSMRHIMRAFGASELLEVRPADPDRRMQAMISGRCASVIDTLLSLYPRMFAVDYGYVPLPLTTESYAYGTVFLFHMRDKIVIWVSPSCSPEYLINAFGVDDIVKLPNDLPENATKENQNLQTIRAQCYKLSGRYLPTEIIGYNDPRESELAALMIDKE